MFSRLTRRQWNNVIIIACILFIGVLNLPTAIKTYLMQQEVNSYPYVLNPELHLLTINLPLVTLDKSSSSWKADPLTQLQAIELAQRWQALVGTEVTDKQFSTIKPTLPAPMTVEVWYVDQEEPQRITIYQAEQFWLFKSWEEKWLAITVDGMYLKLQTLPQKQATSPNLQTEN